MRVPFALGALLLLAACGEDTAPAVAEGESEAAGEVLEGTISDAMLPIDQTRSQAPLAAPDPGEEGEGEGTAPSAGSPPASENNASAEDSESAPEEPSAEAQSE